MLNIVALSSRVTLSDELVTRVYIWLARRYGLVVFIGLLPLLVIQPSRSLALWFMLYGLQVVLFEFIRAKWNSVYQSLPAVLSRTSLSLLFFVALVNVTDRTEVWPLFLLPILSCIVHLRNARWVALTGALAVTLYAASFWHIRSANPASLYILLLNSGALLTLSVGLYHLDRLASQQSRSRSEQRLLEAGKEFLKLDDCQNIVEALIEDVVEGIPGCDHVIVYLYNETEKALCPERWRGKKWGALTDAPIAFEIGEAETGSPICATLARRQTLLISDATPGAFSDLLGRESWIRSLLTAPLYVGPRLVGVVAAAHANPDFFQQEHNPYVSTLAGLAAIAYLNILRFRETERNRSRLDRIPPLVRAWTKLSDELINQASSMSILEKQYWQQIADDARACVEFDRVAINFFDEKGEILKPFVSAGIAPEDWAQLRPKNREILARLCAPQFQYGNSYLILHARAALTDEVINHGHVPASAEARCGRWQPDDGLLVPLGLSSGLLIGLVSLDSPRDIQRPTRSAVSVLELFFREATAIWEDTKRRSGIQVLTKASEALIQEAEMPALHQEIVQEGGPLVDAENCTLYIRSEKPGYLRMAASLHSTAADSEIPIQKNGGGFPAFVAATGESLRLSNGKAQSHPGWNAQDEEKCALPSGERRSRLYVPVQNPQGELLGVLSAENKLGRTSRAGFAPSDLDILATFARLAALAIERARFYQHNRELIRDRERDRIQDDIHELMNFLMAIMMDTEVLQGHLEKIARPSEASEAQALWKRASYFYESLGRIREDVEHPSLVEEGLMSAVCKHAEGLGLEHVTCTDKTSGRFRPEAEHALLRIAQDALDNIREHAKTEGQKLEIDIELATTAEGMITLRIHDNGPGFDVDSTMKKGTFGLRSMQRKAERREGRLQVDSAPGKGSTITAAIPILAHPKLDFVHSGVIVNSDNSCCDFLSTYSSVTGF
jgi:signal transduction histidine kinase/putative methionine-R-sulfoxide reductase with GAF domain